MFLPDAVDFGQRKVEMCARYGLTGLYPLDNKVDLSADDASLSIFKGNVGMMNEAVAVIANLTPFRGVSADVGTAFELGYMAGRGKLCLGYSNDGALYADRVRRTSEVRTGEAGLIDPQGLTVEDFALSDNLMLVHTLDLYRCPLVTPRLPPLDLWYDLTAFEVCVRAAAERLYRARAKS